MCWKIMRFWSSSPLTSFQIQLIFHHRLSRRKERYVLHDTLCSKCNNSLNYYIYINGCYICTRNTHTHTPGRREDDALDARGILRWDKVDHLAKALIELKGLSITNSQARNIKELYDALLDYDKKPITFTARPMKPARCRFACKKQYRVGGVGTEQVKRCFLSAGMPSCSPSKS